MIALIEQLLVKYGESVNSGASPGFGRGGPRINFFQIWEFACGEATGCAW